MKSVSALRNVGPSLKTIELQWSRLGPIVASAGWSDDVVTLPPGELGAQPPSLVNGNAGQRNLVIRRAGRVNRQRPETKRTLDRSLAHVRILNARSQNAELTVKDPAAMNEQAEMIEP